MNEEIDQLREDIKPMDSPRQQFESLRRDTGQRAVLRAEHAREATP